MLDRAGVRGVQTLVAGALGDSQSARRVVNRDGILYVDLNRCRISLFAEAASFSNDVILIAESSRFVKMLANRANFRNDRLPGGLLLLFA